MKYRNAITGRVVEVDEPDPYLEASDRWQPVPDKPARKPERPKREPAPPGHNQDTSGRD